MGMLSWLFRGRRIERELDAEMRSHFEMAVAERIAAGEDPKSARLAATNEFGNELQAREDARQVWRGGFVALVSDLWQDARFGARMLIKNPRVLIDGDHGARVRHRRQRHRVHNVQGPGT